MSSNRRTILTCVINGGGCSTAISMCTRICIIRMVTNFFQGSIHKQVFGEPISPLG